MKYGKPSGTKSSGEFLSDGDDIERLFQLSRSDEQANWGDFKPTMEQLQLKSRANRVTRPPIFSWPRLVMAGMAAVIVILAVGLVTATLLSSKGPVSNTAANQGVQATSVQAVAPTGTIQPASVSPTQQPEASTQATNEQTVSPIATAAGNPGPDANPIQTTAPTDTVPSKLAIQTPLERPASAPSSPAGSPVTIYGTLVSLTGSGNNVILNVRTTEGVLTVNMSGATKISNTNGANGSDATSSLKTGASISATGVLNAQGQLDAASLTVNPQDRPRLVTPGYPDDTK